MATKRSYASLVAENEQMRDTLARIWEITRPEPKMSGPHWALLGPAMRERIHKLTDAALEGHTVAPAAPAAHAPK